MSDVAGGREGQILGGKYKLTKLLGSGGMGDVYAAESNGRQVAIKILHEQHSRNPEASKRFLGEAHVASLIRHKNVVDVLDVGSDERGTPFIVQELLTGEDLHARLAKHGGKVTPQQAVPVLLPVVDAVAHAHTKGVVHRDLKPANIFLARQDGRTVPKLLDFGISRVDGMNMTATGTSMGTPAYMSPELVQGAKDVDARTDVWALGVIIYEMVTGTMPFDADSPGGVFVKIVTTDAPRLEDVEPGVPQALADVVSRCLKRERGERYANAAELARDLHAVLGGRALDPITQKVSRRLIPTAPLAKEPASKNPLDDADDSSALRLASVAPPPPSIASRAAVAPVPASKELPPPTFPHPLPLGAMFGSALVGAVVLGAIVPLDDGLPLGAWLGGLLVGASSVVTIVVGLVLLGGAGGLLARGLSARPVEGGYLVAAGGLASLAWVSFIVLVSDAGPRTLPALLGLGVALAPLGLAVAAGQDIVRRWLRHESEGRVVRTVVVGVGLFLAIQVARGASVEIQAPSTTTVRSP